MALRIGLGHDIHRLATGRPLRLGGVQIPFSHGLDGHSDADVVLHAVCDALLGAAGLGDIGEHFPDNDPAYRGADSAKLLGRVMEQVRAAGWRVVNLDLMIHAQQPRLGPHKAVMRARIAELLAVAIQQINVKAGTNEGLDAIGRAEAIACQAIVLLESRSGG